MFAVASKCPRDIGEHRPAPGVATASVRSSSAKLSAPQAMLSHSRVVIVIRSIFGDSLLNKALIVRLSHNVLSTYSLYGVGLVITDIIPG